jgi:hypothetical protein
MSLIGRVRELGAGAADIRSTISDGCVGMDRVAAPTLALHRAAMGYVGSTLRPVVGFEMPLAPG